MATASDREQHQLGKSLWGGLITTSPAAIGLLMQDGYERIAHIVDTTEDHIRAALASLDDIEVDRVINAIKRDLERLGFSLD